MIIKNSNTPYSALPIFGIVISCLVFIEKKFIYLSHLFLFSFCALLFLHNISYPLAKFLPNSFVVNFQQISQNSFLQIFYKIIFYFTKLINQKILEFRWHKIQLVIYITTHVTNYTKRLNKAKKFFHEWNQRNSFMPFMIIWND